MRRINTRPLTPGDTKAGTLVGTDRFGNKFYENNTEELPRPYPTSRARVSATLS